MESNAEHIEGLAAAKTTQWADNGSPRQTFCQKGETIATAP